MKKAYFEAITKEDQDVNPLFTFLGAKLVFAEEGKAQIEMPISPQLTQGAGLVAGGILATLADEAMAHAVMSTLENGQETVTVEMNIRYLRSTDPKSKGCLISKAAIIKRGRSMNSVSAEIFDSTGRLLATAGGSFMVLSGRKYPQ